MQKNRDWFRRLPKNYRTMDEHALKIPGVIYVNGALRFQDPPALWKREEQTGQGPVPAGKTYTDFSHPWPISMSGRTSVTPKFTTAWIIFAASFPATFAIWALKASSTGPDVAISCAFR